MELGNYLILNDKTIKILLSIFGPQIREFGKGETILEKSWKENRLCLLLKGTAYLCIDNEYGDKQLLDFFVKGQILCHEMLPAPNDGHCCLYAKYPCAIAYLDRRAFAQYADRNPSAPLADLLFDMFRACLSAQNEHCHILQQKTIRGKILAFLHCQNARQKKNAIHIPSPYSDLADYLAIDRSSLMTELSRMHTEQLIEKKAHDIRLLQ